MSHTVPTSRLAFTDDGHADPAQLLDVMADADTRAASTGLTYLAGHTAAPATFQPSPDAPCEAHAWCVSVGPHADHLGREVSLPAGAGVPPILTAFLYTDQDHGVPALTYSPGSGDWQDFTTSEQLREQTAKVRTHAARLDALADQHDAIREASNKEDASTLGVRVATYVRENGTAPELHEALTEVGRGLAESGDTTGARHILDALNVDQCTVLDGQCVEHEDDHGETIHRGREHGASIGALDEILTHRITKWGNDTQPELAVGVGGCWDDLDLTQTDQFIGVVARQLASLLKTRTHLAAAVGEQGGPDAAVVSALADVGGATLTACLAGLETNPHDVANELHRSLDAAQAIHLEAVEGHTARAAYSDELFSTAITTMAAIVKATDNLPLTTHTLRNAIDLIINEAGR